MGKRLGLYASAAVVVAGFGAAGIGMGSGAGAHGRTERFQVTLRGSEETAAADPDGRGQARLDIDTASGEVCWRLRLDRIGTATMAHIHGPAPREATAGVVVLFFDDTEPVDPDALEEGRADGCTTVAATVAAAIATTPEQYYVNVHNARFPAGAIRGQID